MNLNDLWGSTSHFFVYKYKKKSYKKTLKKVAFLVNGWLSIIGV